LNRLIALAKKPFGMPAVSPSKLAPPRSLDLIISWALGRPFKTQGMERPIKASQGKPARKEKAGSETTAEKKLQRIKFSR
jgi:hypothetical protein